MFSAFPFNDVEINHINGKIDNKDVKIKIKWILKFLKIFFIIIDISFFQKLKCLQVT